MTNQHTDEIRAFEEYAKDKYSFDDLPQYSGGRYTNDNVEADWWVWQAATLRYQDALREARGALVGAERVMGGLNGNPLEYGAIREALATINEVLGDKA